MMDFDALFEPVTQINEVLLDLSRISVRLEMLVNKSELLVLDIDPDNERLSLGVKQLEDDPWDTIAQRYPVGSKIKGPIAMS